MFYPDDYDIKLETKFSFSIKNIALLRLEKDIQVEDSEKNIFINENQI